MPSTRRALTAQRRHTRRRRTLTITGIALAAAVGGTGLAASSLMGSASAFGLPLSSTGAPTASASIDATVTHSSTGHVSVHAGSAVTRADANSEAVTALATGRLVAQNASGKTATATLTKSIASLADYRDLDADTVMRRVSVTQTEAESVGAATLVANKRIAAEKTAAAAEARRVAQQKADAARQAAANTPAAAQATAKKLMASQYGWGDEQFSCLVSLWSKESGWNYRAYNASGATGIPQALPGSKMATVASDWSTNATTQIIWGLGYISGSYGTPCAAWAHSEASNWY